VQLKYVKTSDMVTVLQPFMKTPNGILPIEANQMLVLRDMTENVKRMLEMIERVDVPFLSEFTNEVIPIKFAKAEDIAQALGSLSSGGGATTVGQRAGGGATPTTGAGRAPGSPYTPGQPVTPGLGAPGTGTPSTG